MALPTKRKETLIMKQELTPQEWFNWLMVFWNAEWQLDTGDGSSEIIKPAREAPLMEKIDSTTGWFMTNNAKGAWCFFTEVHPILSPFTSITEEHQKELCEKYGFDRCEVNNLGDSAPDISFYGLDNEYDYAVHEIKDSGEIFSSVDSMELRPVNFPTELLLDLYRLGYCPDWLFDNGFAKLR